ncbi:MAG: hypothetical protein ABR985_13620 [Methanotrichaceae archaeon]|jgi:hypothetical protein
MPVQGIPGFAVGNITALVTSETTGPAPTSIIERKSGWTVSTTLTLDGPGLVFFPNRVWHAKAFLESIGIGFEGQIGAVNVNTGAGPLPHPYVVKFDISVPAADPGIPALIEGVYELTVLITLHDLPGDTPMPISAFADGITISFYDA